MTNWTGKRTGDGGVSESIGFLLIFGMVIVGIGLVTLYGYPMLLQQQTSADKQIMEKNMIVLQNDMKSLAYKTVPYKETSLNIGGGTLTVHNTSNSNTHIRIYSESGGPVYEDVRLGDLQYYSVSSDTEITLENGAVVTRPLVESGSVMLAQPRWFFDPTTGTMVINLVTINSTFNISRSGVGTVQMTLGKTNYSVFTPVTSPVCVEYTNGRYSVAWNNYFSQIGQTPPTLCTIGNGYELSPDVGILVIKKNDIMITSV